jgi:integrase
MANSLCVTQDLFFQQFDPRDHYGSETAVEEASSGNASTSQSLWFAAAKLPHKQDSESRLPPHTNRLSSTDNEAREDVSSMSLAEFVRQKFIPEYVDIRRSAGRAHFRAILKHVLPPEQVPRELGRNPEKANVKLRAVHGWPYMDSLRLCEIDPEKIRSLTLTALESGYSIQTVTHIRNVIRVIFSHAITSCSYTGTNPATHVTLPAMARREAHSLTLEQLNQVMKVMRYPERVIALGALLTDMNVAEICGLQWQYVNTSNIGHSIEGDWLPPKTIAVRTQWYRGEFQHVMETRKRLVPVPELLCSVLRDIKIRQHFTKPQDFVVTSRSGTPVYPENIAARRLKAIGKAIEMPWLSWSVFHRTHIRLKSEFGRHLHREYEKFLSIQRR